MFTPQFQITYSCHHLKPKLARFRCLTKKIQRSKYPWVLLIFNEKIRIPAFDFRYHFSQMELTDKQLIQANREMFPGAYIFNRLFLQLLWSSESLIKVEKLPKW